MHLDRLGSGPNSISSSSKKRKVQLVVSKFDGDDGMGSDSSEEDATEAFYTEAIEHEEFESMGPAMGE